jgi:tetratricopeptide (TPR) repeat protein
LARIYLYSKPDTTLLLNMQGLFLSKQIGFLSGEILCLEGTADAHDNLGNYPKALENYFDALKIYETMRNENGIRRITGAIGTIYAEQGEYRHALEYAFKATEMARKLNNKRAMSVQLLNLGDDYNHLELFDSANIYTRQSLELARHANDTDMIGVALNNLAEIKSNMGQNELAMEYYRHAVPFLQTAQDDDVQCDTYLGLAKLFRNAGLSDSCLYYAGSSFAIAKNDGFTKRMYDASIFLTDYYKMNQKIDSAFAYQQIAMATKDSLFSQEKVKQVENLTFQERLRQQEIAEEKQRAEEERRTNLQLIGITAFIITFILFFLLIIRRKTKPRTIEFFGVVALLLVFEFIALFIHPYLEKWTHHTPVYMLLILVGIASILVPVHHRLERFIKEKLAHKIHPVSHSVMQVAQTKTSKNKTKAKK